ncbi:hypothetical protein AB1Y20_018335 [Prymnesium parvum]|uniref:ABM domain-containing protein n=1 Tax=Prymnesium parvum TaxID=97485 RepID=A0AB34JQH7_PRYPA
MTHQGPLHILLSGTTGWIGGELARALLAQSFKVTGINRRPCDIPDLVTLLGDISSADFSKSLEGTPPIDVAIHLAGALGWCSLAQAIDTNIGGTRRFVQAALDKGCKRIIVASSVACVGTCAPSHPPSKLPMSANHPYEGGPWSYAYSKYAVEQLLDLMAAEEKNKDVEFIVVRIGATVTNPPDIRHLDGVVDGKQVSWKVEPAECLEKPYTLEKPEHFPEAALCSIALTDQVDCLVAAVRAHHQPGVRRVACVAPKAFTSASVPELMASWYGADVAKRIDMSHYAIPGHERDPIYDLEEGFRAIGWRPKVDLLEGKEVPELTPKAAPIANGGAMTALPAAPSPVKVDGQKVFLAIVKKVAKEQQQKWLDLANEMAAATWQEEGCEYYNFVRSSTEDTFCIMERWESQGHLDAHAASAHFTRLVPQMDAISETVQFHMSSDALEVSRPPRTTKILVLYDSSTTCTGQMAELVVEGAMQLDHVEVRLRAVPGPDNHWDGKQVRQNHVPATFADVYWADGIACGSPTNLGCISWRMKKFWDDLSQAGYWSKLDGRVGCSFSSVGGAGGGAEIVNQAMNAILMNFGFACFGVTDYVEFKTTMHYGPAVAKAPRNEEEQMICRRLGRRLAEFAAFYISHRREAHPMLASKAHDFARWGGVAIPPRGADMAELVELNKAPFRGPLYVDEISDAFMRSLPIGQPPVTADSSGALLGAAAKPQVGRKTALVYTAMLDYVHGSTAAAASYVSSLLAEQGWRAVVSDDPAKLELPTAPRYDLIVLVNNSGQIFDPAREALTRHLEQGLPVLGLHACLASFLDGKDASGATSLGHTTRVIQEIFGAHFVNHPPPQTGSVVLHRGVPGAWDKPTSLGCLADKLSVYDEFFNYSIDADAFKSVQVLASLDEKTYTGGTMGDAHPIVWSREWGASKARVFYCGLGHFASAYSDDGAEQYVARFIRAGLDYLLNKP